MNEAGYRNAFPPLVQWILASLLVAALVAVIWNVWRASRMPEATQYNQQTEIRLRQLESSYSDIRGSLDSIKVWVKAQDKSIDRNTKAIEHLDARKEDKY